MRNDDSSKTERELLGRSSNEGIKKTSKRKDKKEIEEEIKDED